MTTNDYMMASDSADHDGKQKTFILHENKILCMDWKVLQEAYDAVMAEREEKGDKEPTGVPLSVPIPDYVIEFENESQAIELMDIIKQGCKT